MDQLIHQIEEVERPPAGPPIASRDDWRALPPAILGLLALLLGLLVAGAYSHPALMAQILCALTLGILLLWLTWRHPEYALLAIIAMASVAIHTPELPGPGTLQDVAFFGLIGLLVLRGALREDLAIAEWPVIGPLLLFIGIALFSTVYAILYLGGGIQSTLNELRPLVYFSMALLAAWSITDLARLRTVLIGLFVLADIAAGIIFLLEVLGWSNPWVQAQTGANWRIWWANDSIGGFGSVRVIPSGHFFIFAMGIIAFALLMIGQLGWRMRLLLLLQCLMLNASLLFSYTRSQWTASALAMALVVLLIPRIDKLRFIRGLLVAALISAIALSMFGSLVQQAQDSSFLSTLSKRVGTIFTPDETLETGSIEWRFFENQAALNVLLQHPLLGVGIGQDYRDATLTLGTRLGTSEALLGYVHNSYLYIAVKLGLPGLLTFLWFYLVFLRRSWQIFRRGTSPWARALTLGILASCAMAMPWALTFSLFFTTGCTAALGALVGVVASITQLTPAAAPPE